MVLYVFYDFETTQNTEYTDKAKLHVPNFVYVNSSIRSGRKWKTRSAAMWYEKALVLGRSFGGAAFISNETTPLGQ